MQALLHTCCTGFLVLANPLITQKGTHNIQFEFLQVLQLSHMCVLWCNWHLAVLLMPHHMHWLLPYKCACALPAQGGSQAAKGVVLFMHGFAQGPNAYYQNLKGLADAGFLVIAPEPPFGATPGKQQVRCDAFLLSRSAF